MRAEVKLLNQLTVTIDGRPVCLERKQQLMVGALAIYDGIVAMDVLEQLMWERQKGLAGERLYTCAKLIRAAFDDVSPGAGRLLLTTVRSQGYRLNVPKKDIDYFRFSELRKRAANAADPAERVRLSRAALAVWGEHVGVLGGTPFGGFESQLEEITEQWRREYRSALIICLEAELDCGRHEQVLPELERLAESDAYGKSDQVLARLRMLAHYRCGLDPQKVYLRLYKELQGLGREPDPKTRELQEQILNDDPTIGAPRLRAVSEEPDEADRSAADEPAAEPAAEDEMTLRTATTFHTQITGANPKTNIAKKIIIHERADE